MEHCIFEIQPLLEKVLKARLVPLLHGSPGIGKSSLIHSLAEKFNLEVIDLRLSQCEPTDLMGFPYLEGKKASYKPMDYFPVEGDSLPEGKNGWLLLLDELNSADLYVQKAAYKLILDRMVGNYRLHKNVAVVAAGNLASDKAIVEEMSSALASRMVHFHVKVKPVNWLRWANENRLNYRITGFLDFRPDLLQEKPDNEKDYTFACPRTWHFLSRLIDGVTDEQTLAALSVATIGQGAALEFLAFTQIYQQLPKWSDIRNQPETSAIPSELSVVFALASMIAAHAEVSDLPQIIKYVNRMDSEAQIIMLRNLVARNKAFLQEKPIREWLKTNTHIVSAIT